MKTGMGTVMTEEQKRKEILRGSSAGLFEHVQWGNNTRINRINFHMVMSTICGFFPDINMR